jgi:hypothetical protein
LPLIRISTQLAAGWPGTPAVDHAAANFGAGTGRERDARGASGGLGVDSDAGGKIYIPPDMREFIRQRANDVIAKRHPQTPPKVG